MNIKELISEKEGTTLDILDAINQVNHSAMNYREFPRDLLKENRKE